MLAVTIAYGVPGTLRENMESLVVARLIGDGNRDAPDPLDGQFDDLRRQKLRIGSRDLKIAATALVNHALLLSANRSDFEAVPGVRVENWLD